MLHQNVRFTPKSGHLSGPQECPLSAKSGHQSIAAERLLASEQQARVADFVAYHNDQRYHEGVILRVVDRDSCGIPSLIGS